MDNIEMQRYMQRALRLADKGAGKVSPNPMVGAIIVKDGLVIGQGFHKQFGQAHAEVNALADCAKRGGNAAGSTMFVTLEPCCHHGKTAPCTEAIVKAGIAQVVIATTDDFELVAGRGIDFLRNNGIEVTVGICEKEARRLNAGFFKLQKCSQPLVILKWAQSINGKLAYPRQRSSDTKPRWISSEKSRKHVHKIRSRCGAILAGIGTVETDNPLLNARLGPTAAQPLRVVLDSKLRISLASKLVRSARDYPLLIFTSEHSVLSKPQQVEALMANRCQVMALASDDKGHLSLEAALLELSKRGVAELLVEGGAKVHEAFISKRLADRVMVYIAPIFITGRAVADIGLAFASENENNRIELENIRKTHFDDDILIEGDIRHE